MSIRCCDIDDVDGINIIYITEVDVNLVMKVCSKAVMKNILSLLTERVNIYFLNGRCF